jgi:hypothetical protein
MANGFANETDRTGRRRETLETPSDACTWSARRAGTPETGDTCVVVLITQRSARLPPASAVDGPQLVEVLALGGLESVPVVLVVPG